MKKLRLAIYIITFLSWGITLTSVAQTKNIDSLLLALAKTDTHKEKVLILNHLGESYKKTDPKKGIAYVQQAVKLAHRHSLKQLEAESLVMLAGLYINSREYKIAQQSFLKAIDLSQSSKFSQILAKALLGMGTLKCKERKFSESFVYLNKSLKYKMSLLNQADAYYYLGLAQQMTNHSEQGLKFYNKSLKIYKKKQKIYKQCQVYADLGYLYQMRDQLDSAFLMTKKGLTLLNKSKAKSFIKADLLFRQGYVLQAIGDISSSIKSFWQSLQIYENLKHQGRKVAILTAIGYSYYLNSDYENADKIYQKAHKLIKPNEVSHEYAELKLSLGNNFLAQQKYVMAKKSYDEGLKLFKSIDNVLGQSKTLINIGSIFSAQKKYAEALKYYQMAKQKTASSPSSFLNTYIDYRMIDVHIKQRHFELAEKYLQKVKKSVQMATLKMDYFRLHYDLDSARANHSEAIKWYKKYKALDDSLKNRKKELLMDILKIQYATQHPGQQSATNSLPQKKSSFWQGRELFMFVLILVLLGILAFIYYLYHKKNLAHQKLLQVTSEKNSQTLDEYQPINPELEKSITEKDHELTVQAMHLLRKNQALEHILKNLKQWTKNSKTQDKGDIQDLIKYLKKQVDSENDWKQFHHSFEIAHPGFYNRLQTKHPTLTEYDLKLGALIRLGLDTVELATFLNITMDSVRKARFRLRKKLDLQDEQLNDYLRNT